MGERGSNVETPGPVLRPSGVLMCAIMNNDLATGGGHRGFVKIKNAVELVVGRYPWIKAQRAGKIQCNDGLGEEKIPAICRKIGVNAAQDGNKMIFK